MSIWLMPSFAWVDEVRSNMDWSSCIVCLYMLMTDLISLFPLQFNHWLQAWKVGISDFVKLYINSFRMWSEKLTNPKVHTSWDKNNYIFFTSGVHCTHGFNRTGFLIIAYLVEKDDWRLVIFWFNRVRSVNLLLRESKLVHDNCQGWLPWIRTH